MNKVIVSLALGVLGLFGIWYLLDKQPFKLSPPENVSVSHVKVNNQTTITTFLPKNIEASRTGLAAFDKFSDDYAMLFRAAANTKPSLWMKNMKFDIDMVWLSDEDEVVHINHDVSHKDQKTIYQAPQEAGARCVIELNAGASQRFGIKLGDKFKFTDRNEPLCQPENYN